MFSVYEGKIYVSALNLALFRSYSPCVMLKTHYIALYKLSDTSYVFVLISLEIEPT